MKISKKLTPGIFIFFLMAASMAVWAIRVIPAKKISQPITHQRAVVVKTYDTVLIKKFDQLASSLNLGNSFTYSGLLNVFDGADTSGTVKNVPFVCSRRGKDCYMLFGHTETVNARGIYLFIEHNQKKIWLSQQKQITTAPMMDPAAFKKGLVFENYTLTREINGSIATIEFKNERHRTCKEYALSYDTTSNKVTRIMARLTNIQDPFNDRKDRVMEMRFSNWTTDADPDKFLVIKDVLVENNGKLFLAKKYNAYELLRIQ